MFRKVASAVAPAAAISRTSCLAKRRYLALRCVRQQRRSLADSSASIGVDAYAPPNNGNDSRAPLSGSVSVEGITSLRQICEALRAAKGPDGHVSPATVQPLVERSQSLAAEASVGIDELADLADAFVDLRLRTPLRDMMPMIIKLLQNSDAKSLGADALPSVVRILGATGRGSLYPAEAFEFCVQHIDSMDESSLAAYLYEAGRHGLRAKHFSDAGMNRAIALVPQMNVSNLMKSVQGVVRFVKDWRKFFLAAQPRMMDLIREMSITQLILGLRVGRSMRQYSPLIDLHTACCAQLLQQIGSMSLSQGAMCISMCSFEPKFRIQSHSLVRAVAKAWAEQEDISRLSVVEVVDSLQAFSSWGMMPQPLTNRLSDILIERKIELKYAGNVSLWVTATESLARVEHFESKWPFVALEFAKDTHFVGRVSFYLQCSLLRAFSRLRIVDDEVYSNIASHLVKDVGLFGEIQHVAPVLEAFATANSIDERLFDAVYDLVIDWLEAETLDMSKKVVGEAFSRVVLSFVVAGYHKRHESFAAFLDYAFFSELQDSRPETVRRLAQIADACLIEAPEIASLCQFPERMAAARGGVTAKRAAMTSPVLEPRVMRELEAALKDLGWQFDISASLSEASPWSVDVSLERHTGKKIGLLVHGPRDLFRNGLPVETSSLRETGMLALKQRLLEATVASTTAPAPASPPVAPSVAAASPPTAERGWRIGIVQHNVWDALSSSEERKAFLERTLKRALEGPGASTSQ